MYHHHIVRRDGIAVDLDYVLSVFLVIGCLDSVGRKLSGLTYRHKSGTEFKGKDRTADESSGLDSHHFSNAFVAIKLRKVPTNDMKSARVLEQSCEITEYDTLLREVIHITNVRFQIFHSLKILCLIS